MTKNKVNWKIVWIGLIGLLSFSNTVQGQVTYRATEDALKQLLKDVEALRKAPIKSGKKDAKGEKGTSKSANLLGGSYYTMPGDTLNEIINTHMHELPIKANIVRLAIVKANPHAFKRSNPNWMYAGKNIRLPTVDDVRKVVFKADSRKKRLSSDPERWIQYP